MTCLLLCPLFPRTKSQSKGLARPGRLAHVSLGHIPGKSLLTPCLSGQERFSDRLVPPWHHLEGNPEPEKSRHLPELTQQGTVAEKCRSESLVLEQTALVPTPALILICLGNLGQSPLSAPQYARS